MNTRFPDFDFANAGEVKESLCARVVSEDIHLWSHGYIVTNLYVSPVAEVEDHTTQESATFPDDSSRLSSFAHPVIGPVPDLPQETHYSSHGSLSETCLHSFMTLQPESYSKSPIVSPLRLFRR